MVSKRKGVKEFVLLTRANLKSIAVLPVIAVFCAILTFGNVYAAPAELDIVRDSGEIHGVLDFCGSGGSGGIEVSIPGKSFMAYTDGNGDFTLSYVPVGSWALVFNKNGQVLGATNTPVIVERRRVTDLVEQLGGPISLCEDLDGDGSAPDIDCDDSNPNISPNAPERCGDGKDNNCDGSTDETCPTCTDSDDDGFYAQQYCGLRDCNDSNASISPSARESCDGIDNNCDGSIDEESAHDALTYYYDEDGDNYGVPTQQLTSCSAPEGYALDNTDCDDFSPNINPSAIERCNGIDNDCNGEVDDFCSNRVCTDDESAFVEACLNNCADDTICLTECINEPGAITENCIQGQQGLTLCGLSSGCLVDNVNFLSCAFDSCPEQWEGVYGTYVPTECASGEQRQCGTDEGTCAFGLQTCGANGRWGECAGGINPVDEICGDGMDNDCDGVADNAPTGFFPDSDGDGYPVDGVPVEACESPAGYAAWRDVPDCNDTNPSIFPGQSLYSPEAQDSDCNGSLDLKYEILAEYEVTETPSGGYLCTLHVPGWDGIEIPECGSSGFWLLGPLEEEVDCNVGEYEVRAQECR